MRIETRNKVQHILLKTRNTLINRLSSVYTLVPSIIFQQRSTIIFYRMLYTELETYSGVDIEYVYVRYKCVQRGWYAILLYSIVYT
jgi:hypothetical protein